jgi:DNA-directed RNA polymerase subunit M/transcription elongation factor TFIIS
LSHEENAEHQGKTQNPFRSGAGRSGETTRPDEARQGDESAVMPNTIADGQHFPMPCPSCHQNQAIPFMAGTQLESGAIEVAMRCRNCGHEWRFDMPITSDRRRGARTPPVHGDGIL